MGQSGWVGQGDPAQEQAFAGVKGSVEGDCSPLTIWRGAQDAGPVGKGSGDQGCGGVVAVVVLVRAR